VNRSTNFSSMAYSMMMLAPPALKFHFPVTTRSWAAVESIADVPRLMATFEGMSDQPLADDSAGGGNLVQDPNGMHDLRIGRRITT